MDYDEFQRQQPEYWEGYHAKSIFDNPYWKNWPNNPESEDATKGRRFVEGYCAK